MIDAPCKNCMERSVSCHDKCPKYILYRKELDNIREKELEERRNIPIGYFRHKH